MPEEPPRSPLEEQMRQAQALRRRLAALSVEASSRDGSVTARVGPTGVPVSLAIKDAALDNGAQWLAETVLDCFTRAGQSVGGRARDAVRETVGDALDLDACWASRGRTRRHRLQGPPPAPG